MFNLQNVIFESEEENVEFYLCLPIIEEQNTRAVTPIVGMGGFVNLYPLNCSDIKFAPKLLVEVEKVKTSRSITKKYPLYRSGETMIDVVALGELLIDFASRSADPNGYPTMQALPGGAPANFLAALTKYGKCTAFLGKVGDDALGICW